MRHFLEIVRCCYDVGMETDCNDDGQGKRGYHTGRYLISENDTKTLNNTKDRIIMLDQRWVVTSLL